MSWKLKCGTINAGLTLAKHAREHGRCGGGQTIEIGANRGKEIVARAAAAALLHLLLCGQLRVGHCGRIAGRSRAVLFDLDDALLGGRLFGRLCQITQR